MATPSVNIPQPLSGLEIKKGIAVRMTEGLPEDVVEPLKEIIVSGLGKTCSLLDGSAYAKFKAEWTLTWWHTKNGVKADWWIKYTLDDFGRITAGGIGTPVPDAPDYAKTIIGTIDEQPPDKFRRETDQPIPKPTELKKTEEPKLSMSHATRGPGKRRDV